jgi:outer membrane murein-binding lipoprotein Lpp
VLGSPGPADDKPANVRFFERVLSSHVVDLPRPAPSLRIGNQQVPLEVLDLEQVKRAYYHQVYALYEQVKDRPDDRAARETMTFLTDRIDMLLFLAAQAGTAIERVGSEKTAPAMDALAGTLRRALSGPPELMKVVQGEPGDKALICEREVSGGSQTTDFVARYKRAHGAAAADAPLGDLLPAFWATLSKKVGPEPVERFRRADAWRFAAQYAAEVGELDRVEYFRLSPREAADVPEGLPELARFREDPVARLAGRHLAHFAAFLDRAWRSNDIMWGRIDATGVLWDVLIRRRGYHLPRERARALAAELISKEWHKEPGELAELAALVQKYADGGVDERGFAQALLQTHQRHVLVDAVPGVIADAAGQHRRRGKVEVAKKPDGEIRPEAAQRLLEAFHDTIRDPLLRTAASEAVDALLTKQPQAIVDYVGERYAVGEKGLAELPPDRVATQALQAGRVVNAMLRAALPNRGLLSRLRWPLKPLGTALQTMHLVAHSIRRGLFPLVWLVTLLTSAAFGASSLLLLQGTDRWVLFGAALAVVGALLGAPNIWFGGSRLSWVRVPLLAGMLVAAVGVITTLHLSSTRPVTVGLANNPIVTWIAVMQAVIVAVLLGGTILLGARLGAASSERKRLQRTREDLEKERQALARFVAAMQQEAAKRNQPPATPAAVVVEIAATTPSGAIRVDSAPTVTVPRRP